jgi:hypothetical protein
MEEYRYFYVRKTRKGNEYVQRMKYAKKKRVFNERKIYNKFKLGVTKKRICSDFNISYYLLEQLIAKHPDTTKI